MDSPDPFLRLLGFQHDINLCDVSIFICQSWRLKLTEFSHALLHVAGTAVVSWFTFKVLRADPHTIQFFLPLCADGGIFLWTAIKYAWLGLKELVDDHLPRFSEVAVNHYRSTRRALLVWISRALGEDRQGPLIPLANDSSSRDTLLQPLSFPSQDLDQIAPPNPDIDDDEEDTPPSPQNPPNL